MTLSGTYDFGVNTPIYSIITEAYERIGIQASKLSTNDLDSARRSFQYTMADIANRGPNLWTINQYSFSLTTSQSTQALSSYNVDVLEAFIRQNSQDFIIQGISRSEYASIPNKTQTSGRPTQYYLDRTITPTLYLWPLPQDTSCTLYLNIMDFQQDIGDFSNTLDAPQRWFDAIAALLAVRLAIKWSPQRVADLKTLANEAFSAATSEDTENVPLRIQPDTLGRRFG